MRKGFVKGRVGRWEDGPDPLFLLAGSLERFKTRCESGPLCVKGHLTLLVRGGGDLRLLQVTFLCWWTEMLLVT